MRIRGLRKLSPAGAFAVLAGLLAGSAAAEELPRPNYMNATIVSIEHSPLDSVEVEYITKNLPFGLFAWPSFSVTHVDPALPWRSDWREADSGIRGFKDEIDGLFRAARDRGVGLHLVICSGLARRLDIYKDAKLEDVRNCQWYNDNTLASTEQMSDPGAFDRYVFGTLSRYARKLRANLEAKGRAAAAYLKSKMDEAPNVLLAVSGWGEAELNSLRADHTKGVQDFFCDYSPFAVLEFRDWIQQTGLYAEGGPYSGQGWEEGGAVFRGPTGLAAFNAAFGTAFATWDLKYFDWKLSDDWDEDPTDEENRDPGRIPYASCVQGGMMPAEGPSVVPGGFDPPRIMAPGEKFWDLWNLFRETMVRSFVRDLARWASEAGVSDSRWFSHQMPTDYLFGTNPAVHDKNARYYTSASTLRTADLSPYGSAGATIYDIKFPDHFVRTTDGVLPAIAQMSRNWAIMEYDAETYPLGFTVEPGPPEFLLDQYLKVYGHHVHLINFWRWLDETGEHRIKGTNKEAALKAFVARIRDKARRKDLETVFDPPRVHGLSAGAEESAGPGQSRGPAVRLEWSTKIWPRLDWEWRQWGDFSLFEVFRGDRPGFPADDAHRIGTAAEPFYIDSSAEPGKGLFYRVRAVNVRGVSGPASNAAGAESPVRQASANSET